MTFCMALPSRVPDLAWSLVYLDSSMIRGDLDFFLNLRTWLALRWPSHNPDLEIIKATLTLAWLWYDRYPNIKMSANVASTCVCPWPWPHLELKQTLMWAWPLLWSDFEKINTLAGSQNSSTLTKALLVWPWFGPDHLILVIPWPWTGL